MKPMMKVYVAGAYSGPDVLTVLDNMRIGIASSARVAKLGMAPFCPWSDYHFALFTAGLGLDFFYRYSMEFLRSCNCLYIVSNPRNAGSKGLAGELAEAQRLEIPAFDMEHELLEYKKKWEALHV